MMGRATDEKLIEHADRARTRAIAPYSNFLVGSALTNGSGVIYEGCNIENASYGLSMCAERVALLSALAGGERDFRAIAVVTEADEPATPCGPCRQLLWEYCGDIDVTLANTAGKRRSYKLSELIPHPFDFRKE